MTEPLTLAEAKAHLRIAHTSEDDYITSLIEAARLEIEGVTWRAIVRAERTATLDWFPSGREPIYLPAPPLFSVDEIAYIDAAGEDQTIDSFRVDATHEPGLVVPAYGASWPETYDVPAAVSITFTAGYADGEVPENVRHCIRLKLAELYEQRTPGVSEKRTTLDRMLERIRFRDHRIEATLLGVGELWRGGTAIAWEPGHFAT